MKRICVFILLAVLLLTILSGCRKSCDDEFQNDIYSVEYPAVEFKIA